MTTKMIKIKNGYFYKININNNVIYINFDSLGAQNITFKFNENELPKNVKLSKLTDITINEGDKVVFKGDVCTVTKRENSFETLLTGLFTLHLTK